MNLILTIAYRFKTLLFALYVNFTLISVSNSQVCDKWVFGYVPTYTQDAFGGSISYLTSSEYSKLTHIAHLGPYVNADGSLNMVPNGATNIRLQQGVAEAHANGKPILLAFQGWYDTYLPAISTSGGRATLINNVLNLYDTYGYDGIDVDLEPIMSPWVTEIQSGNPNYITFINTLYDSLQTRISPYTNEKPLLTCAANGYAGPVLNQLQSKFDMINILTYDLAGPYPGWVTWHDSPVYDGGQVLPSTGNPMPSVDGEILMAINAGVAPPKLGVGVSMDAFRWKGGSGTSTGGVTAPMQSYTTDPTWTRFSYSDFITNYNIGGTYVYDTDAQMSYYSKDLSGSVDDEFWSYNDQTSIEDKVDYVWDNILGGTMIWELHSGYIPTNTSGEKIPQLNYIYNQTCAKAAACPDPYTICIGESYTLSANGAVSGIQWYKDGNIIPAPNGTSSVLVVSEIGVYTWGALDADGCEVNNCCAITIIEGNCCSTSETHTSPVCNHNNTGGIATDDYFSFSVTGTVIGGSGNYVVKIESWSSSQIISGQPINIVGNGLSGNPLLPANGSNITVIVEDATDNTCFMTFTVSSTSCSTCPTLNCGTVTVQKN